MLSIKWNTQLSTKYPSIHHMLLCPNLDNPMGCVLNKICRKTMRKRPTMMLALNKYKRKCLSINISFPTLLLYHIYKAKYKINFIFKTKYDGLGASQEALVVKNLPANARNVRNAGSVSGRPPGGGHRNPPKYSCLENPMDGGVWWTEDPGGLQSIGSQRVGHSWSNLARIHAWWIRIFSIRKMSILLRLMWKFNEITIKLSTDFFVYIYIYVYT